MPKILYQRKKFTAATLELIEWCNRICNEYEQQGLSLSLRQLYYQAVSRDIIPNKQESYNRLGNVVTDARLAGLIDWDILEDRGRSVTELSHWDSPKDILWAASRSFRQDKWVTQDYYPIVLIEKDALTGVFEGVCSELDIPLAACKGYPSASFLWRLGNGRFRRAIRSRRRPIVFHFGDHDPSGIQMTDDLESRLSLFAERQVEVRRIALTMAQVERYDPPPNPAKTTDSRYAAYQEQFGTESWELDALNPTTLADLVRESVLSVRDEDKWAEAVERETEESKRLKEVYRRWDEVTYYLDRNDDDDEEYGAEERSESEDPD